MDCSYGVVADIEFVMIAQNIVVGCEVGMGLSQGASYASCNDVWNNVFNWYGPDPTGMNGNISVDPLFCDATQDDYTLSTPSGCLPGNHPDGAACGIIGALGEGCSGPVPTVDTSWGRVKSRFQE